VALRRRSRRTLPTMSRTRRSRRTVATVVVLVLVSLTVITVDQTGRTHDLTAGVRSVANDVFSPLRQAVDDVVRPLGDFFAGAVHYGALQRENENLRATVGRLDQQLAQRSFDVQQLRQLTTLEHLPFVGSLPTVPAQVTALDMSNFDADVAIDKGRDDGVTVGMPVVGSGGLVGVVVEASHTQATVQLVTDGQSRVGVTFGGRQASYATVAGEGPGQPLAALFVAPGTPLHRGEVMATNGLAGASFPPGIPVGRVASFSTPSGADQMTVRVDPAADLAHLTYVDVVQWQPTP